MSKTVNCRMPCSNGRIITKFDNTPVYEHGQFMGFGKNHEYVQCPLTECPINKPQKTVDFSFDS